MAAASAETEKPKPDITLWISENEESDVDDEIIEYDGVPRARAETEKPKPDITLWISENEESDVDDEIIEYDGVPPALRALIKDIVKENKPPTATKKKRADYNPQTLPRWKHSESQEDLRNFREKVMEELRLNDGPNEETDIDADDIPTWTHNFKTFTAKPLPFTATTGPTISSTDPLTLFTSVWDRKIMNLIVEETNRYARQTAELQKNEDIPEDHALVKWTDTTVEEMYIMLALITFASIRGTDDFLFGSRMLPLPVFAEIMGLQRFAALCRCLHFVDNTKLPETDKMIAKMKPVMDHCNKKFPELYQPRQFLDVDDSLLLSKKGSEHGIRKQANYFGIRTYELAEVFTGYVLKCLQYPGTDRDFTYKNKAQIVLDLVNEYSNKGHRIVTNTYFSSVYLARLLKSKGFDNVGQVNKTRKDLPEIIQRLEQDKNQPDLYKYNGNKIRIVSRHCGDISVVAWSEWDITTLSTYHASEMRASKRGVRRPGVTLDYSKVREKISDKDKDLIEYVMIRQPAERWYVRQFRRLLNISLRNIYVIYKFNMRNDPCLKQVSFRYKLADQLLDAYGVKEKIEKARAMSMVDESDDDDSDDESWTDLDSDDSSGDCCIM